MNDRVDILMATYNGEKFVQEQIESILEQTHQNFQILVGDDGSTDRTREIVSEFQKKHPDKIILLPFTDNVGHLNNFSRLADFAESDYIMLSDQDDIWLPQKIEWTLSKMKELEDKHGASTPLMIFTDATLVSDDLKVIHPSLWKFSRWDPVLCSTIERLLVDNFCTGCTMMLNKELLLLSTPMPPIAKFHDYWIALIAASVGKIGHVDKPTLLFRRHGSTSSQTFTPDRQWFTNFVIRNPNFQALMEIQIGKSALRAYYIYRRYSGMMTDQTKSLFETFITLKDHGFLRELYLRWRYGFNYPNFWWSLAVLWGSFRMGKMDQKYSLKI